MIVTIEVVVIDNLSSCVAIQLVVIDSLSGRAAIQLVVIDNLPGRVCYTNDNGVRRRCRLVSVGHALARRRCGVEVVDVSAVFSVQQGGVAAAVVARGDVVDALIAAEADEVDTPTLVTGYGVEGAPACTSTGLGNSGGQSC